MSVTVIGAGKFALEIAHYLADAGGKVERYLAVGDEPVHAPADLCTPLDEAVLEEGAPVVLALSDPRLRRTVIDEVVTARGLVAENVVHPTSLVDAASLEGPGNVIGPNCYLGVNTVLGGYNVLNYHCTVGHHSRLGSNNFVAPNFHCGNSVTVGDDNFFGLSCTVAPEISIGGGNRFQAGIALFDDAASGMSYLVPNRVKAISAS